MDWSLRAGFNPVSPARPGPCTQQVTNFTLRRYADWYPLSHPRNPKANGGVNCHQEALSAQEGPSPTQKNHVPLRLTEPTRPQGQTLVTAGGRSCRSPSGTHQPLGAFWLQAEGQSFCCRKRTRTCDAPGGQVPSTRCCPFLGYWVGP